MSRLTDSELGEIQRRDELLEPVRYRTQAELDRRILLAEVASLRSQLRGVLLVGELLAKTGLGAASLNGEQRAEWQRRRQERDTESAARLVHVLSDTEDD